MNTLAQGGAASRRPTRDSAHCISVELAGEASPRRAAGGSPSLRKRFSFIILFFMILGVSSVCAEDGYRLWLRYDRIDDNAARENYTKALAKITLATPTGTDSATLTAARDELANALTGMLGIAPTISLRSVSSDTALGDEGFHIRSEQGRVEISANRDIGILYGVFELLRLVQTRQSVAALSLTSTPRFERRVLNHWDNLNGFVERGYAGFSLWKWFTLPEVIEPRYRDYARANASIGINGALLTNVNGDALVLTPHYLRKVAALADTFRPYGIRVYLTARFSAPVEIGGLTTADPLDEKVSTWWRGKTDEIYKLIPDFGGFVVKANSEGQPGPQNYGRNHADGANLLADALAPHDGVVFWRAFVYAAEIPDDRAKQAFNEFTPLDGKFRPNVIIQIKNGPIDFMPREPFHPLFGAMPRTPLALELQITQEYLGCSTQLAYLAPLFKETLDSDTCSNGPGSTVAKNISTIVGVSNIGDDRNWTGHPLAASNWYAFGRLAWNHELTSAAIADEWTRMTFSNRPAVVAPITAMLGASRETVVDYSMPLGLHHIMAWDHHYGPGPWIDQGRPDWTSLYYHRADKNGLGFDRTPTGSNATSQYAAPVRDRFNALATCPENLLLWFHHVPWDYRMPSSGRTLWDELCQRYQRGVNTVADWQTTWKNLDGQIDAERHAHVASLLQIQLRDAREWRDACLLYFQTFSQRPLPEGVDKAPYPLEHYKAKHLNYVPGTPSGK